MRNAYSGFARTLVGLVALAVFAGCHHHAPLSTPNHFIELEEQESSAYAYRATSADGVVLALRVLDLDESRGGDLEFWLDALRLRLRQMGGYALLDTQSVSTHAGWKGTQLRFGYDDKGRPHSYWVSVFLHQPHLYLVEAGGPEDKFRAHTPAITAAVQSLEP